MEQKEKNKRKLLLLLPLLLLPFAALIFWSFGGGKAKTPDGNAAFSQGINTTLPGAQLKGQPAKDKLALYNQATKDSAAAKSNTSGSAFASLGWDTTGFSKSKTVPAGSAQASEVKITQKLAEINRQIHLPEQTTGYAPYSPPMQASPDMDRPEKLLKQKSQGNAPDPEMQQLNAMLEKIEDIQHPERVNEQLKKEVKAEPDSIYKAFRAVILKGGKVRTGTSVELQLADTIRIKGELIPKGHSVFGLCQVTNQRVLLSIKNIRLGTSILPVDLTVYDMDGMPGIRANDADTQDALRAGSDNAVQGMEFMPMDETVATQAAGAGVEAAKTLFSKKVRGIKAKLKKDYPVLLRNNQPDKR